MNSASRDDPLELPASFAEDATVPFASGFVALSKFVVANGMSAEVKTAFRNRPHLVDGASGYLRMDVISPLERPEEVWPLTFWTDEESFRAWHHSHAYHESHRGIPKGLKLMPGETKITHFEHVSSRHAQETDTRAGRRSSSRPEDGDRRGIG